MDPERLKFQPLPEGQGGEAERAVGPEGRGSGARGRHGDAVGGRGARACRETRRRGTPAAPLLPRNRDLVKRYFGESVTERSRRV